MEGSSTNSSASTFSGKGFLEYSRTMKERLISEGLWHCVEDGCKKPITQGMSSREMEELKKEIMNNERALSLIHQSLSPPILMRIIDATDAKNAWDNLHSMFQTDSKKNVKADESVDESSGEFVKNTVPPNEEGSMLLSGDKPFFDVVLMKSSLKPLCHMNFPNRVNSLLPLTNMVAKVRFFGQIYEIYFYGKRKQKSFGPGWRQVVEEHDLREGDFLIFEIMESSNSKLEMNMHIMKPYIPPEMEQEMKKRRIEHNTPTIAIDEDDDEE